jgi:REP element-mobilizing transposase RayT
VVNCSECQRATEPWDQRERLLTYLITFACYGCHLHGDESGSVDREHNFPGSRLVASDLMRFSAERGHRDQPPYSMDRERREAVLASVMERCSPRNYSLLAAHVRTNHVHIVVESEARPERLMNDLKSYASRCLNRLGLDEPDRNAGRGMGTRGGCGNRRVCRRQSGMWLTSRVSEWPCLR